MISKIIALMKKYREIILYLVFGFSSMLLNMAVYALSFNVLHIPNVVSTVIAWFAAVIFAFFTNKIFVFESKTKKTNEKLTEFFSFFGCRIATGLVDVLIMFVSVDALGFNSTIWKFISNVVITVLNYIASKFWIFKKKQ